jgi:hypothetical protein
MARMNIYVSEDLKERMDKAEEKSNWSQVASRAFEVELGEIAKRKKVKDMNSVVQRLKTSKVEYENVSFKDGYECGRKWAEESAEYSELKHAYEIDVDDSIFSDPEDDDDGRAFVVGHMITREGEKVWDFWEGVFGEWQPAKDFEFYKGFLAGASEVYEKVRDEL